MANSKRKFLAFILLVSFFVSSTCIDEEFDEVLANNEYSDYELPRTIVPESYDIKFTQIDFKKFTFIGLVDIIATVQADTNKIFLHCGKSLECSVNAINVNKPKQAKIDIKDVLRNETTDIMQIIVIQNLEKKSEIEFSLQFAGNLRDDMVGFYKSSYLTENKKVTEERFLAATQFEAIHARHAFPCFDEPRLKAKFKIALTVPKGYNCLSNMPLTKENPPATADPLVNHCKFETSVKMSTYLVAFVVSDFTSEVFNGKTRKVQVWSQNAMRDQRNYSLDVADRSIDYFEKLLDQNYTLTKMDLVAVPDFSAGAMENWGLLTFRESNLLVDSTHTSAIHEQRVATVVVHEVAHQWFGNLITPEYWDYLWLSEGFARYFEYMGTNVVQSKKRWRLNDQFVVDQHQSALRVDSAPDSKAMTRIAKTTSEIKSMGDKICYNKGASVIRMLEHAIGHDNFGKALKAYVKAMKGGSAKPDDLWKAVQSQVDPKSNLKVEQIMNGWTAQPGYPVISVAITPEAITLKQERFYITNPEGKPADYKWHVPITWTSPTSNKSEPVKVFWLSNDAAKISNEKKADLLIFNVNSAGFYRVLYDKNTLNKIIDLLKKDHMKIDVLNRAAFIDDMLNLAKAEKVDYETVFKAMQYLRKEEEYLPIKSAFNTLDHLIKKFKDTTDQKIFEDYILSLITDLYHKLSFDDKKDEDHLKILLRQELINRACSLEYPDCVVRAQKHFEDWRSKNILVPKNQRSAVYSTAIKHGDLKAWDFLWDQYTKSNVATEQVTILYALGYSSDKKILEKYLLDALTKPYKASLIRQQDLKTVFNGIQSSSLENALYLIEFVDNHYEAIIKGKVIDGDNVISILKAALQTYPTKRFIAKIENFINHWKITGKSLDSLKSSIKAADLEVNWFDKYSKPLANLIKSEKDSESKTSPGNTIAYRLPGNIIPESYELELEPNITEAKFIGSVFITAKVQEDSDEIILHSDQLEFGKEDIKVSEMGSAGIFTISIFNLRFEKKYNFARITLGDRLKKNTAVRIEIKKYKGILNSEMRGFYISHYKDIKGKQRGLAATHLEPTGARRMFPCFDEPALKASFIIKVKVPDDTYKAISNMKGKQDKGVYTFEKTPKMSTYLVALIVSDFETLSDKEKKYSVFANPLVKHQLNYSLEVIAPIVDFFEKTLGIKYELPKLDMVALPDFSSGAMENWGLLTYRETGMLYDPIMSTLGNKQSIRNVIAHEISHQWFGDLVSPQWWKYLWLSEGFARYFQCFAHTKTEELWDLENQFVVDYLQVSMVNDATTSTHPVTHDVFSPKEIRDIFDNISYHKAGSLIRMVQNLIGEEAFYKALKKYLLECSHSVGTPEKLFNAWQNEVPKDIDFNVEKVMSNWTTKPGFPVVDAAFNGKIVTLKQSRFFLKKPKENTPKTLWFVPITYVSKVSKGVVRNKTCQWFKDEEEKIEIPDADKGWVILNANQIGYYRVNYDKKTWANIIKALNSPDDRKLIPVVNRAQLIDDLMTFGRAGMVDYATVFSALSYLTQETNYIPWKAFFNNMPYLTRRFEGRPEVNDLYKKFLISLLQPNFKNLGFEEKKNDSHTDVFLRKLVLDWLCKLDHSECVKGAKEIFAKEIEKNIQVPPSQRSFAYCTGIKTGNKDVFMKMNDKLRKSNYATEKMTILSALSCTKDRELLKSLLQDAITPYPQSEIRFQDAKTVFTNVINASPEGLEVALEFIGTNYEKIQKYFGDHDTIQSMITTVSKRITTKEQIKRLEALENTLQNVTELKETFTTAKNRINNEMKWFEENAGKIFEILRKKPENLPTTSHRLEINAIPSAYDIYLEPYFEPEFRFDGKVIISMKVSKDTFDIVLHANEIEILSIQDSKNIYKDLTFTMVPETQKMIIYFKTSVASGTELKLEIKYKGHLKDDMKGFYRSSYKDGQGNTRWIASTQFEPTHARRAFPCFDEPSFKATFSVNILKPPGYSTLSNMASTRKEEAGPGNRKWDKYDKSVIMSPYILAFIVSDFVSVPEHPTTVSVWSRKQLEGYMKNAAVFGEQTLKILNGYTLVPYPLKDMNLVAIPDFSAGAMENWGLVTFREYGLSYNETEISASYRRYVVTTVAHELVHMWFGNLVTCDWWDYTWLNEGFADYLSYLVSDQIKPEWQIMKQFVVLNVHSALDTDSSETSHPMNNKVNTPSEAQAGFDTIAYKKGSSVLRMFRDSFGHQIFQEALHNYLDSRKYKTAKPEHVVGAFQERANYYQSLPGGLKPEEVTKVMNSWIDQAGYPVINATRLQENITLVQERFVLSPSNSSVKAKEYLVPITYTTETLHNFNDTTPKMWLMGKEKKSFTVDAKDKWYILNIQEVGFYRVNYDENNWKRLSDVLNSDKFTDIGEVNRAQIIDDSFSLARAGYIDYEIPLNISKYLRKETSHLPWKAFFSAVSYLSRRVETDNTTKNLFSQYVMNLVTPGVEKIGFKEDLTKDQHLDQLNKEMLMTYACKYGHKDCATKAAEYFKAPETITPNIAYPIYCSAIEHGNLTEWNALYDKYTKTLLASEYITMLKALGCSRNSDILKMYMNHITEKNSTIRKQDVGTAFSSIYATTQEGLNAAINYFEENLNKLKDYYGNWEEVGSLFTGSAAYIATEEQVKRLEKILKENKAPNIKNSLESAIKNANKNLEWYKSKSERITSWLNSHYNPGKDGQQGNNSASASTLSLSILVCIGLMHLLFHR